jgi:basic amino acid/polyamine antiporter, APA family
MIRMTRITVAAPHIEGDRVALARTLNLPLTVLFGLGVTIGAGIYVLIGATAGRAGMHVPLAFLLAAIVMAPTAASFAELASRMPVSAGEAAYVEAGFGSEWIARVVGLMVIAVGIISAATIAKGSAGYIQEFVDLKAGVIIAAVILLMGAVAAWGILESVAIVALMTLIEVGGLLLLIGFGVASSPGITKRLPEIWTGLGSMAAITGMLSASLLAFFAFIGFEGLANIAEEVKEPERTLPKAIFLTLVISTLFYILVGWIAVIAVSPLELATSRAPLSLVFERVTGASPAAISAIAIVATVNGVIVQMVMASRVIYGLADRRLLPIALARINSITKTPLLATILVVIAVLVLAIAFPLESLASTTSLLTLVIFSFVNAALLQLKRSPTPMSSGCFIVPFWVPIVGCVLCIGLLFGNIFGWVNA